MIETLTPKCKNQVTKERQTKGKEGYKRGEQKRPLWVVLVSLFGLGLIIYTWYRVYTDHVPFSWIIALGIFLY